jgi:N6-adenosine-specific RNA methylase IME4
MRASRDLVIEHDDRAAAAPWAVRIMDAWRQSVTAIIETGRLIAEAKAALPHGAFLLLVDEDLPFGRRTAQRLMAIAADTRLQNATHVSHLPASWGALYELTRLDDDHFETALADGTINPEMERGAISTVVKRQRRAVREWNLGARIQASPRRQYGVLLADPPWRTEAYSRDTGLNKSPENHYPTMTLEEICAFRVGNVPVDELGFDDSLLGLWRKANSPEAGVIACRAWGYEVVTEFVWRKIYPGDRLGTGYWQWNEHEVFVLAKRGDVPCPAPGEQWRSVIDSPIGAHSQKPEIFRQMLEAYFPNLPKAELFRRGEAPAGWDVFGNEAEAGQ